MLAVLQQIADESPDTNPYLGDAEARRDRARLAALPADAPAADRWSAHIDLGQAELQLGQTDAAIADFLAARRLVAGAGDAAQLAPWITSGLFRLGMAYLRQGETENCMLNDSATSCILPLRGGAIHVRQDPSRRAIATFTEALRAGPDPSVKLALEWLLNIANMTVGTYPDGVPAEYLIPPKTFESAQTIPHFTNIASRLGLNTMNNAGGAIVDDFDNDGYLDIVTSNWDPKGQMHFFRNNGDGTFTDRTVEAGLQGLYGGLNMVQADYNNDGNVDILVLRGAWLGANGRQPNSLLRNNGDGTFTDVTFEAGLAAVNYPTQTAAWADYDNDGYLDLYVGNESTPDLRAPSQLFHNNGDGTFTDVAAKAGVQNVDFAKGVAWGDYDGDGWPDLYVSNLGGLNSLFHNNHDGTFTDVAVRLGVQYPIDSFPCWFWDFDNDGILDLYVGAYHVNIDDLAADALGLDRKAELAHLYHGNGHGGFDEVAQQEGLTHPNSPMGSNFGDLDNDGYPDFYLGTGSPALQNIMPNVMYLNRQGRGFTDVSYSGGFAHLQKGHAVAFADLDNDGDQDVFEEMGGAYPVDQFTNALYENPGFGNHWITIKLVGIKSNRSAIGARIRAEVVDNGVRRSIYKWVNSGGSFGGNPLRQTIGLGKAARIETLEIDWPTTGLTQRFDNVPVDQTIQIVEGDHAYSTVTLKTLALGR